MNRHRRRYRKLLTPAYGAFKSDRAFDPAFDPPSTRLTLHLAKATPYLVSGLCGEPLATAAAARQNGCNDARGPFADILVEADLGVAGSTPWVCFSAAGLL
jgi:hypothetical protein